MSSQKYLLRSFTAFPRLEQQQRINIMRGLTLLALAGISLAMSRNPAHVNKRHLLERARPATHLDTRSAPPTYGSSNTSYIIPQNANTTKFAVDGNAIPDVNFDIGESYAGLLPISDKANASELFFWFLPSANELAGDEILSASFKSIPVRHSQYAYTDHSLAEWRTRLLQS